MINTLAWGDQMQWKLIGVVVPLLLAGCAGFNAPPPTTGYRTAATGQQPAAVPAKPLLRRKTALGLFKITKSAETLLAAMAPGMQPGAFAAVSLGERLQASGKFSVTMVPASGEGDAIDDYPTLPQIGADTLLQGSVVEVRRSELPRAGFIATDKVVTYRVRLDVRMLDAQGGQVIYTATGTGEASADAAGPGKASLTEDRTLIERAFGAAISDVQKMVFAKLEERPWRADLVMAQDKRLQVSAGRAQGLVPGMQLAIMRSGDLVGNRRGALIYAAPPAQIGVVRVVGFAGDQEDAPALVETVSGTTQAGKLATVFVAPLP